jgi:acyl-CoA:acyl-CoA alkyltransferase
MIQALGVGKDLDFPTFPTLGNMGSVSLPVSFAIGAKKRAIKSGDKIALLGFGSGINTIFAGVQW